MNIVMGNAKIPLALLKDSLALTFSGMARRWVATSSPFPLTPALSLWERERSGPFAG